MLEIELKKRLVQARKRAGFTTPETAAARIAMGSSIFPRRHAS